MPVSVNFPMSAGMPYSSSKASRQAAAPAPPVMISVPSISNSAAIRLVIRLSCGCPWLRHDQLDGAAEAEVERLLQRDVEETKLLELLGAAERADVDGAEPAVGDQLRQLLLGGRIVTGDEDIELLAADLAGDQGGGEGGVERLHHRRSLRNELGDLLGGGGSRWRRQPVPGLGVDRVGDVNDGLAGELVGVLANGVLDAGIVDGEDDHLAAERRPRIERGGGATAVLGELLRIRWVAVHDLDLVTSRDDAGSDAAAHVACTNDRHSCHGATSSGSSRARQLPCRFRRCKPYGSPTVAQGRGVGPARRRPEQRDRRVTRTVCFLISAGRRASGKSVAWPGRRTPP